MDAANWFETRATYTHSRLEYGFGLVVAVTLFFWHITDVRWLPAVALFAYIDLIGYIPGAIAHHRAHGRPISRGYYVAYNVMHSMITQSLVVLAWMWLIKPEWALLVIPIHLFGDRSIFGNFLKPFAVEFEPRRHPAFARLLAEVRAAPPAARPGVQVRSR
ncbi:hypothetical protein J5X84_15275 [Streptosporangiaceae bacterium NEAU-GS5]|nr:hypothetical protein [Streptosporangiaceae bacterium NEAU-GS5]